MQANRYFASVAPAPSELLEQRGMETASARRRRKLEELCARYGRLSIATRAGVNPVALEQVLKGRLLPPKADGTRSPRALGDAAAKAIEDAYGLPRGWFDAADEAPPISEEALDIAKVYERMSPSEQQRFRLLLLAAREGVNPSEIRPAPRLGPASDYKGGDSWFDKLDSTPLPLSEPKRRKGDVS